MPSIHNANEMSSIEGFMNLTDGFNYNSQKLQKLQLKIMKSLSQTKREDEWKLYMTKSELVQERSPHAEEI
jgi:hypothetical protein